MIVGNGPFVILLSCKRRHRPWWLMESGFASGVIILDHICYWVLKIQRIGMGKKCERFREVAVILATFTMVKKETFLDLLLMVKTIIP